MKTSFLRLVFSLMVPLLGAAGGACSESGSLFNDGDGDDGASGGKGAAVAGSGGGTAASGAGGNTPSCGEFEQPCCAGEVCDSAHLTCHDGTCGQQSASETGKACDKNGDCESGICLPVGDGQAVCTSPCGAGGDCVAGWECAPLAGQATDICQCQASNEACNVQDDDCDGIVDNEPAVGVACAGELGAGAVCDDGQCACGAGHSMCSGACLATDSDPNNCGGCGNACPAGSACTGGTCSCPSGGTACGGACVDTTADENNCGGCGTKCAAGASCTPSGCVCPGGQQQCNGVCVDTVTDVSNCGGCGTKCAAGASCTPNGCDCPGNQQVCSGACVDTSSDENHCGGCGNVCEPGASCHWITGYGVMCCAHVGEPCSAGCCPDVNYCSGLTNPPTCVY